nr:reverse transcriptase domain protein [Colletotrichum truncatum]KAF6801596.1 reverse transcriptase domain protein [Colletotrichum truncatum]
MNSTTETAKYTQRLQTDSDWNHWFNNLQMLANVHEVWDYVNPKGTKINTKPRLEFPDPKDLRQEERANYSNVISYGKAIYQEEKDQYNQVRRSLLEIHSWIMNTVAATYISQVSKEQTVRDIIKALEKQLAPDNFGRQQMVLERYNKHMLSIKRAKLGGWLIIYREIMDEAQTIGIPALSDPVTQVSEFLKAVKQIAPDYYTSASYDFTKRYKDDPTYSSISKTAGIEQANDFRSWVRTFHPDWLNAAPLKDTSFATWQGENEQGIKQGAKREQKCAACPNESHRFVDCKHANPKKRGPNYHEDNPENKKALERLNEYLQKKPHLKRIVEKLRKGASDQQSQKSPDRATSSSNWRNTTQSSSHYTQEVSDGEGSLSSFVTIVNQGEASLYSGFPLSDSMIVDSGTGFHICNDSSRLHDLDYTVTKDFTTGGGDVHAIAKGTMIIKPNQGGKSNNKEIKVRNVWLVPGYPTSLLGTEPLKQKGIIFTTGIPGLIDSKGRLLFKTPNRYGQYIIEAGPALLNNTSFSNTEKTVRFSPTVERKPTKGFQSTRQPLPTSSAEAKLWHERLGHPGAEGLEQLLKTALGIQIKGITKVECDACAVGKATRQISRRNPDHWPTAVGDYLSLDFFTLSKAYNREKVILLVSDGWSGFFWIRTLRTRKEGLQAMTELAAYLERQCFIKISILRLDWEVALRNAFELWAAVNGYMIERSAEYTGAQNPAERAGGAVFMIMRALRFQSRFPELMAPELAKAAVYLSNRLPRRRHKWQTPLGLVNTWLNSHQQSTHKRAEKPQLAHLRRYGCRAYPLTQNYKRGIEKSNKTAPRAHIGYLCGYDSTNIYRIWIPAIGKVMRTRDVTFDENTLYDPRIEDTSKLSQMELEFQFTEMDIPFTNPIEQDLDTAGWDGEDFSDNITGPLPASNPAAQETTPATPMQEKESGDFQLPTPTSLSPTVQLSDSQTTEGVGETPETPEVSPTPEQSDQSETIEETSTDRLELQQTPVIELEPEEIIPQDSSTVIPNIARRGRPRGSRNHNIYNRSAPLGQTNQQPPEATRSSQRLRRARESHFTLQSTDTVKGRDQWDASADDLGNPHQKTLPPVPKNYSEAIKHQYSHKWIAAMNIENRSLWQMGTFEMIDLGNIDQDTQRIIPLKWVFTYKGSKGYLKKFKARICVRGDLQPTNELETYASTLAGISLRSLMAIVARFDLETLQLDAVNAFTHATIDEEVYVWFPPGFRQEGYCLALRKALYGLRRSPLLWQKNLERSFKKLGLIPLQEDDCIYTNQYFIVFHFVDDIGVIYHKKHETKVKEAVQQLKKEYEMKDMGELSIFLGVRIIRERKTRQLWMSLDNYISKVTEEFKIRTSTKRRQTPMAIDNLVPSPGQATPEEINYYQRKVGSINYAGVIGRPDIARTSSRLAEFLSNPSSEHQKAAYECLQYLEDNKYLAIEFNCKGKGVLYCASDASFADDSVTRKSTQGYVMMLFGGPIHWKAVKQRRVVTSSTEAELAALTAATREYMATIRLMEQLNLQLDDKYIMQCDNKQTLRLLIAERPQATSKLRHININNLWLRQELQKGSIDFQWVPTNEMVADGMTKAMPAQKHNHFIAQLGMANIEHLIEKNAV